MYFQAEEDLARAGGGRASMSAMHTEGEQDVGAWAVVKGQKNRGSHSRQAVSADRAGRQVQQVTSCPFSSQKIMFRHIA